MATEKKDPAEKVEGMREQVQADSTQAGAKATEKRADAAEAPNPDSPATDGSPLGSTKYHATSQPDQASEADKDAADNPVAFRGIETEYAPDNEIETTVRRMAGEGATAGEIAAYRADALAKLGE